jgi:hypothetical protein
MDLIDYTNATLRDAEDAVRRYNAGHYAKAGLPNIALDELAQGLFANGLGTTLERLTNQVTFIGKEYGGVAAFPVALTLAPAMARDVFATRSSYDLTVCGVPPLRQAPASRATLQVLYAPFVRELHGKKNWLTWASKFWHFLNADAFPIEDSTVDKFFRLYNLSVSLDKYEQLLKQHAHFSVAHEEWLPRLRAVDGGHAWNDVKLWDKAFYGIAEINRARKKGAVGRR